MEIGTFEAEPTWTEFLRKLTRRGLRGVKAVTERLLRQRARRSPANSSRLIIG
jgi:transposase-like protein